jgi:Ca2+/Na+ antiporter
MIEQAALILGLWVFAAGCAVGESVTPQMMILAVVIAAIGSTLALAL